MELSFILGAGFSVPEGYPTRKGINDRLREISYNEIMIYPDGTALFLNGIVDPNANDASLVQKLFVDQFLNYYVTTIIDKIESFDYEYFFDYYRGLTKGKYKCCVFERFTDRFRGKYNCKTDNLNLLSNFHNTFSQLLSGLLSKGVPQITYLSRPYSKYPEFLNYIETAKDSFNKVHFHTLNHDLLLEELAHSEAISNDLSDGFDISDSPFYSKSYVDDSVVQLERFTNKFDTKFGLYKLHGSIDYYVYSQDTNDKTSIKVPYGISYTELTRKYLNDSNELVSDLCFWNYYPDFLSGTTEKINSYKEDHYYQYVFNHFKENLENSNYLISIGYGLGDSKINEMIIDYFLTDTTKKMLVITPYKPKSELFNYPNVIYYGQGKGIEHIDEKEIEKLLQSLF